MKGFLWSFSTKLHELFGRDDDFYAEKMRIVADDRVEKARSSDVKFLSEIDDDLGCLDDNDLVILGEDHFSQDHGEMASEIVADYNPDVLAHEVPIGSKLIEPDYWKFDWVIQDNEGFEGVAENAYSIVKDDYDFDADFSEFCRTPIYKFGEEALNDLIGLVSENGFEGVESEFKQLYDNLSFLKDARADKLEHPVFFDVITSLNQLEREEDCNTEIESIAYRRPSYLDSGAPRWFNKKREQRESHFAEKISNYLDNHETVLAEIGSNHAVSPVVHRMLPDNIDYQTIYLE